MLKDIQRRLVTADFYAFRKMGSGLCTLLSERCSDWLSFSQRVWSRNHVAFASRSSFSMGLVGQWPHARCTLDIRRCAWMFKTKQREDAADSLKCMTCKNDQLCLPWDMKSDAKSLESESDSPFKSLRQKSHGSSWTRMRWRSSTACSRSSMEYGDHVISSSPT